MKIVRVICAFLFLTLAVAVVTVQSNDRVDPNETYRVRLLDLLEITVEKEHNVPEAASIYNARTHDMLCMSFDDINSVGHPVLNAIKACDKALEPGWQADAVIYTLTQPCNLSVFAAKMVGIRNLVYGIKRSDLLLDHQDSSDLTKDSGVQNSSDPTVIVTGPFATQEISAAFPTFVKPKEPESISYQELSSP